MKSSSGRKNLASAAWKIELRVLQINIIVEYSEESLEVAGTRQLKEDITFMWAGRWGISRLTPESSRLQRNRVVTVPMYPPLCCARFLFALV